MSWRNDPLAAPLARYLEEHVDEELGHDETLLDDLELLGVDRASVLARMPSPAVAALVGSQYYWILHYHPVAFLGYVALMEGYPPTPELIDELIERTGFPRDAFRTYVEHAELDPGHRDHLDRTIDSLPLDAVARGGDGDLGDRDRGSGRELARGAAGRTVGTLPRRWPANE